MARRRAAEAVNIDRLHRESPLSDADKGAGDWIGSCVAQTLGLGKLAGGCVYATQGGKASNYASNQ